VEAYSRECPWCGHFFDAIDLLGVCDVCSKPSRVGRNGVLVVLIDETPQERCPDDLFRNTPLPVIFEWMESGGGPVTRSIRYGSKPPLAQVHKQLATRFKWLQALLNEYGVQTEFRDIESPSHEADWLGTVFANAKKLHTITWFHCEDRFDLVCEYTNEGGAIHALPPDAKYHLKPT
jgi:hypothetical protein